jgi:surface antigen
MAMARLWQALSRRFPLCLVVAALALASGACSMPIGSLNGKDEDKTAVDRTGSIAAIPVAATTGQAAANQANTHQNMVDEPAETDLAIARATVSEVLGRGGKDTSAPWENPKTGARGTVTPVASAYNQDGFTCRDFLASYVRAGSETWMQGEACRMHQGRWEVRKLKPWKRS